MQAQAQAKTQTKPAAKQRTLFSLTEEMQMLLEVLEADEGVDAKQADSEEKAILAGFWAEACEDRKAKVDAYCGLVTEFLSRSKVRKAEADRLRALADADESRAKRLKQALHEHLQATQTPKLETPRFKVAVQKNGGKQPVKVSLPAAELPEPFRVVKYEPNNDLIRLALSKGEAVAGCELVERGTHLRIR